MKSDRVIDIAEGFHVVGKRDITETRAQLGGGHRLVNGNGRVLGEELHEAQDFTERFPGLVARQYRVGHRDGTGIDERIAGDAALTLGAGQWS